MKPVNKRQGRSDKACDEYPLAAESIKSEGYFRKIFKSHRAVMMLIDPVNGAIIDANLAAVEFYGYSY